MNYISIILTPLILVISRFNRSNIQEATVVFASVSNIYLITKFFETECQFRVIMNINIWQTLLKFICAVDYEQGLGECLNPTKAK
jgi:hypothetical protein